MKFVSVSQGEEIKLGVLSNDEKKVLFLDKVDENLAQMDMIDILEVNELSGGLTMTMIKDAHAVAELSGEGWVTRSDYTPEPIIEYPIHDILCVGKNYKDHVNEVKLFFHEDDKKQEPSQKKEIAANDKAPQTFPSIYFAKRVNRLIGDEGEVKAWLDLDPKLDYEVELGVIIGKSGINIPKEEALNHIFGYTVIQELSSRTYQGQFVQWFKGKSLDGYCTIGPVIATADAFDWPPTLDISCKVNGEVRQSSNTGILMTDLATIIHELSLGMTLEAGDIIATGTPAGVAMGMAEPKFLQVGDVIESEIEGIGVLTNTIV